MGCCELRHESKKNQYIIESNENNSNAENDNKVVDVNNYNTKISSNNQFNFSTRDYQIGKNTFSIKKHVIDITDISGNETINNIPSPLSKEKQDLIFRKNQYEKYKYIFSGDLPVNPRFKGRKNKKGIINK